MSDWIPVLQRKKLHVGCGKRNFGVEWIHADGCGWAEKHLDDTDGYPHIDYDTVRYFPDLLEKMELVYASHVLEYFDREEAKMVLKNWFELLKPGGTLRLAVPDFFNMVQGYWNDGWPLETILGPLYGKMKMCSKQIYHKTVYDYNSLKNLLESVGFVNYRRWDWRTVEHGHIDDHSQAYIPHMSKDSGLHISLNVETDRPK